MQRRITRSLAAALVLAVVALLAPAEAKGSKGVRRNSALHGKPRKKGPVSYTHLTLPTKA